MKNETMKKPPTREFRGWKGGLAIILAGEAIAIPAGLKAMDSLLTHDYSAVIGYGSLALGSLVATSLGLMRYYDFITLE